MYTSQFFAETDRAEIKALVATHGLACLVSTGPGGFNATHAPVLFDPDASDGETMIGHMARSNPHWRMIEDAAETLLVFRTPDAYITPSVYVVEKDVPTWNYAAVHVHGAWKPILDARETRRVLKRTVEHYERVIGSGWTMDQIAARTVETLARGVTAFQIRIRRIEAIQKMSQDKRHADVEAVISTLCPHAGAGADVAARMQRVTLDTGRHRR